MQDTILQNNNLFLVKRVSTTKASQSVMLLVVLHNIHFQHLSCKLQKDLSVYWVEQSSKESLSFYIKNTLARRAVRLQESK